MSTYKVIGLMSGSSLDGVDLVYCKFENVAGKWQYEILETAYTPYPTKWKLRLRNLVLQNAITYIKTHTFYGHYLAELINQFIAQKEIDKQEIDFIASHGQTIFHQPDKLLTSQIGDGAAIAVKTGLPVICNFRTCDVALGGQGAPIVPIGDVHLFAEHRFCLNLGGIANISCKVNDERVIAYDTCASNLVLNKLAGHFNLDYDEGGKIAAQGKVHDDLLAELNSSWYYRKPYPKSLSGGWVNRVMLPIFNRFRVTPQGKLRTAVEHMAIQIATEINHIYEREGIPPNPEDSMLVTGGGALNTFLMERIADKAPVKVVIPDEDTVNFKEALIMGFIGVLRIREEVNCLSSVTGAKKDTVGGTIYYAD